MRAAPAGRTRLLRRVAVPLIVLVLGVLIGRATASSPRAPSAIPAHTGAAAPVRTDAGVVVSFPETREGAASAAAAYQQAFAGPSILRPGVLEARIAALATPDFAARMLSANGLGVARLATGPIGVGLAHGQQTLYTAVPIGYRVESFGGGRARVETWGLTLLGNAGTVEPAAWFGTAHTELVWSGGRWRIAATGASFGPTPALAMKPGPLKAYDVLDVLRGLHGYVLAP